MLQGCKSDKKRHGNLASLPEPHKQQCISVDWNFIHCSHSTDIKMFDEVISQNKLKLAWEQKL